MKRSTSLPAVAGEDLSHVLRFHPRCPFKADDITEYAPALIGLMRDVKSNEARAIQRIRLAADGKKVCRMMLGAAKRCAIKLDPDEHVQSGIIACEGSKPAWPRGK
jgi:putative DNA primase/helicase